DPSSGETRSYDLGTQVGAIVERESGGFAVAVEDGLGFWSPGSEIELIASPDTPANRFNDGATDREGRFWAGTMAKSGGGPVGSLYRLDVDHSVHTMQDEVIVSNGLGWSPDNTVMYYCDTGHKTIWAYDFDAATGAISNRRAHIVVPDDPGEGGPDGLTIDAEGYLWSARWDGWKVVRYDPGGRPEREISVPAARVTSVMFGGSDLDDLYITTARVGIDAASLAEDQPHAGGLFRIRPGVRGIAETPYRG
ncbi:MAG: SMP-30/gluconolactonase/LRE family protein, partial [Spirochaetota bacterium]